MTRTATATATATQPDQLLYQQHEVEEREKQVYYRQRQSAPSTEEAEADDDDDDDGGRGTTGRVASGVDEVAFLNVNRSPPSSSEDFIMMSPLSRSPFDSSSPSPNPTRGVRAAAAAAVAAVPPHPTSFSSSSPGTGLFGKEIRRYAESRDVREMLFCAAFFVICAALSHAPFFKPLERPVPSQRLENSGDYVRNLMYDEEDVGETVPDWMLLLLAIVMPVSVQLLVVAAFVRDDDTDARGGIGGVVVGGGVGGGVGGDTNNTATDDADPVVGNVAVGSERLDQVGTGGHFRNDWRKRVYFFHCTLCAYSVAFGITLVVTEFIKLYAGYLRPVFYEMCQPDEENGNYQTCTAGDDEMRKSFPSGHASTSFCGLTILSMFARNQFGIPSLLRGRRKRMRNHLLAIATEQQQHAQQFLRQRRRENDGNGLDNRGGAAAAPADDDVPVPTSTLATATKRTPLMTDAMIADTYDGTVGGHSWNNRHHDDDSNRLDGNFGGFGDVDDDRGGLAAGNDVFAARFFSALSLIPMLLAVFVAASRVADNRHFPADVVGGSVIGASCASFAHHLWWAS